MTFPGYVEPGRLRVPVPAAVQNSDLQINILRRATWRGISVLAAILIADPSCSVVILLIQVSPRSRVRARAKGAGTLFLPLGVPVPVRLWKWQFSPEKSFSFEKVTL